MSGNTIIYNPFANNNRGLEKSEELKKILNGEIKTVDITTINDYSEFFSGISSDERIILCGGDGTLNRFINATRGLDIKNDIFIYPGGNGNDFLNDLGMAGKTEIVKINSYLEDLPTVYIDNFESTLFINGIGYGLDGYCCEVGDQMKEKSSKPVNYAGIAIKGMLGGFRPRNATVTVDGKTSRYEKVWIAPTMYGRYYGGGMIPAPEQDRNDPEGKVTLMVWHGSGIIPTLITFPKIFKGEHVSKKNMIDIIVGHDITVEFDEPSPLQIDGETVKNVRVYRVVSKPKK